MGDADYLQFLLRFLPFVARIFLPKRGCAKGIKMKLNPIYLAIVANLFICNAASADLTDTLPETVVTANNVAETTDQAMVNVSIISRADIERAQSLDVIELLRHSAGIDVNRTGGYGQSSTIFMRGSNSNHTLFLIDGVRVSSSNSGLYDLAHMPIDLIERIEIVRGPRAAIWGSDAIGGVVQIFTRKLDGGQASFRVGSYGVMQSSVSVGEKIGDFAFGAQAGFTNANGFSAQNEDGFSFDPDRDGYINRHLKVFGKGLLGKQEIALNASGANADVEFDQGASEIKTHQISLAVSGEFNSFWSHRATLGFAYEDIVTPDFFSRFLTRRENFDWVHQFELSEQQNLTFGASLQHERGSTVDLFADAAQYDESRRNDAVFVRHRAHWGDLNTELSGRFDDNSVFGSEFTPQFALGYDFTQSLRLYGSYGEGFRAPNLNELYSPGFDGLFAGNPNLNAEHSNSVEIGLQQNGEVVQLKFNLFRNRIEDLISYTGGATFQAENIAVARIVGAEFELATQWAGWDWSWHATVQDPENAITGVALLRRPKRKFGFTLERNFESNWSFGGNVLYVSSRPDFGGELDAYTTLELHTAWQFAPQWHAQIRLDNVFDETYFLANGFNTAGRSVQFGLRRTW